MEKVYHGKLILADKGIENGYLGVTGGIICYIGTEKPQAREYIEVKDYIAPGFVDIHCHDCPTASGYEAPLRVADYHYEPGGEKPLCSRLFAFRGCKNDGQKSRPGHAFL